MYVGKTNNPAKRLKRHLTKKEVDTKCSKWINSLLFNNTKPIFEIIDIASLEDWQAKEKHYILLFKSFGAKLLNQVPGGGGCLEMTQEIKDKIGSANKGRKRNDLSALNVSSKGYKILQLCDGVIVGEHESMRAAGKAVKRSYRRIQMMISGTGKKVNHVGGFTFKRVVCET